MLVTSQPFRDHAGPPKVISEVRKGPAYYDIDFRPKLSGELLVKDANDKKWWPKRASIRNGQLNIASGAGNHEGLSSGLKLPLRGLSLRAGPLPNSLCLCSGQNVILTMQACNSRSYEAWVRTIAIELIRQTPLERIKYLDIFTLLDCWSPQRLKDCNSNEIPAEDVPKETDVELRCRLCTPVPAEVNEDEQMIERLLKKCQNPECYVPVREKLVLFESLCKLSRKAKSSEDVSYRMSCPLIDGHDKRATSMHDITNFKAVREICKYFERVNNDNIKYGTMTRFNRASTEQA